MKILLTGGGTGGHFYPIVAVAEELQKLIKDEKLLGADIYYVSDSAFNERALFDNNIIFKKIPTGKMRRYFSIANFFDIFKTAWAVLKAIFLLYKIYPDVVFGKGGYASFPALFAARFLRIPVVIHESDSVPGRVNLWAGKFALRIAVSYPETAAYFPKDKVAFTGNPIRREIMMKANEGAYEFLNLESTLPVLLVIGGSQGSELINDTVIDILPELLEKYQVIHQTGKKNFDIVKKTADIVIEKSLHKKRYRAFDYLDDLAIRMAAGAASLIISRAGSSLFEIAAWEVPSIIIPITDTNGDHQRKNAYIYEEAGACTVIEEANLSPHILQAEIDRLIDKPEIREAMVAKAKEFARLDAGNKIAREILNIALTHEISL